MWKCFSSVDHFSPVELPCSMPASLEASAWMIIWGSRCWIFPHCKGSSFPSTKGVPPWLHYPVSHGHCRTLFFCRANICSLDLRLKFLVAWKSPGIVETPVLIFSLKKQKSFSLHLLQSPETLCFTGCMTGFLRLITKPKCCNWKIIVSLAMRISGNVLPSSNISSR